MSCEGRVRLGPPEGLARSVRVGLCTIGLPLFFFPLRAVVFSASARFPPKRKCPHNIGATPKPSTAQSLVILQRFPFSRRFSDPSSHSGAISFFLLRKLDPQHERDLICLTPGSVERVFYFRRLVLSCLSSCDVRPSSPPATLFSKSALVERPASTSCSFFFQPLPPAIFEGLLRPTQAPCLVVLLVWFFR